MAEEKPIDYLTGFFSKEAINPFLEECMRDALANKKVFSLALIDLDRFKKFNDKYGHLFGDEVLKYASSTIRLTFQGDQYRFFRYGGDEFIIVFLNMDNKEVARSLEVCCHNLSHRPFLFNNKLYDITFSCGVVSFPGDEESREGLIDRADEAMYFSKNHGRNQVTLAGKIKFLKIRNILMLSGSIVFVLLSLLISYRLLFKETVVSTIHKIKNVKIFTGPIKDVIVLKSGGIYKGYILEETEDKVILNMDLEEGEGIVDFKKEKISSIKYGSGRPSQDKKLSEGDNAEEASE